MFHRLWTLPALLALLAGCASPAPAPAPQYVPSPASADRFAWRVLRDAAAASILSALPADLAAANTPPAPADPAALEAWAEPITRWLDAEARASALDGQGLAAAQAARALLAASLRDGLDLAQAARARGHTISDDAVLAEVAWRIIAYSHPLRADAARADAATAAWAGRWRGEGGAPGVIAGRLLGAAIAAAVVEG
jgi:hypothetical protein